MICPNCLGDGCTICDRQPWPPETWIDLTDEDIEQLVCDGLDELKRRSETLLKLERIWARSASP